jgi:predicted nucleotidyltransferase component of viral defense system
LHPSGAIKGRQKAQSLEHDAALPGGASVKTESKKNLAASVRARLLNLVKQRGEDLDLLLKRYGIERLLFRLSQSTHRDAFILKGAMLFELWMGRAHRTTKDLDLLGSGSADIPRLETLFRELCTLPCEPDGLEFLPETIRGVEIREDNLYQGVRITMTARLGVARIAIQVDIGFGDAVYPPPEEVDYPSLLGFPAPKLRAYSQATVIAEKFHVMVELGLANSRLKDYHDIWTILRSFEIPEDTLRQALQATFERRRTTLPTALPEALTTTFSSDGQKQAQWKAFLRRTGAETTPDLQDVVADLAGAMAGVLMIERPTKPTDDP